MNLKEKCLFLQDRLERLTEISLSLSKENNINIILELILEEARKITNADGQTLYMKSHDGNNIDFKIVKNTSKNIFMGGTSEKKILYKPIKLFDEIGKPNLKNVNTYVAHTGKTLNITDPYNNDEFDFSGTIEIDKKK